MKKIGRPKKENKQNRMSVSFSKEAWEILQLVEPGRRSELISLVFAAYAPMFPLFFKKK